MNQITLKVNGHDVIVKTDQVINQEWAREMIESISKLENELRAEAKTV